jgi:hypothetical protein
VLQTDRTVLCVLQVSAGMATAVLLSCVLQRNWEHWQVKVHF